MYLRMRRKDSLSELVFLDRSSSLVFSLGSTVNQLALRPFGNLPRGRAKPGDAPERYPGPVDEWNRMRSM